MQIVSNEFFRRMETYPYLAKITLDDADTIQSDPVNGDPIQNITFHGGSNGDSSTISIGCAVAASVNFTLDKSLVSISFAQRKTHISLGMEIGGVVEWLDMGNYIVTDVNEDDDIITVTAMDPIAARFEVTYEDIEGFDFTSADGISALAFATALCQRRGVTVDFSGLEDHVLKGFLPDGCTERNLLGMVAALYGRFAIIARDNVLRFRWYQDTDLKITGDSYYDDGMEKARYVFSVAWLKCYNEVLEETLIEGDPEADQGIYFVCPWMTQEMLATLWANLGNFSYTPVTGLSFLGDPRLDPGDIITMENLAGESFRVPVMEISHDFDGGLKTEISAQGQTKTDAYEGPVQREAKRTRAQIIKRLEGIDISVENAENEISFLQFRADEITQQVQNAEDNISRLQIRSDEIAAKVESNEGDIANLQIQSDEIQTRVESAEGALAEVQQTAGKVAVKVTDAAGNTLSTYIDADKWEAMRTEGGVVTSGFYFDFTLRRFVYDGTGVFRSPDGTSYITVEGNEIILYAKNMDTDEFLAKTRIGFVSDADGVDYPYIIVGNTTDGQMGLFKKFYNGLWLGNSVPKDATGEFHGMNNSVGFFINTQETAAYFVKGADMREIILENTVTAVFA